MSGRGIAPKLSYRLLDPNTGAVVVQDLVHLHQSRWTVRALLPGYPGSSTIGDFSLPLPPAGSPKFQANRDQYDAILNSSNAGIGLKVEGYLGDHASGTPVVSGVITKMDLPLDGPWVLSGYDTLYWLQQSQMIPGELFGSPVAGVLPTPTLEVVEALTCTHEIVWDDDFSNWSGGGTGHVSGDYVNSNWTFTSSDPYEADPALTANTTGATEAVILSNTGWGRFSQYSFSTVSVRGTMQCGTPGSGLVASGIFVIMLADNPYNNGVELQVLMRQNASGFYDVEAYVFQKSGGTYTLKSSATGIFTNQLGPWRYEVTIAHTTDAGAEKYNVFINGKDANVDTGGFGTLNGRIGMRFNVAAGGTPAVYVNSLQFRARTTGFGGLAFAWGTPRFAQGSWISDGGLITQQIKTTEQTHLDMLVLAASMKGSLIRKTPGAGYKADQVDYGPQPGIDRSGQLVFREGPGGNIVAQGTTTANVAETYATDTKMNAIPTAADGGNSGGTVIWRKIGAAGDMVLTDTVSDVGAFAWEVLSGYARSIQQRKAFPLAATQVAVARTPDLVGINNGLGPRECDFVRAVLPTYGFDFIVLITGFILDETSIAMIYFLNDFPERALGGMAGLQRLQRTADFLGTTYNR